MILIFLCPICKSTPKYQKLTENHNHTHFKDKNHLNIKFPFARYLSFLIAKLLLSIGKLFIEVSNLPQILPLLICKPKVFILSFNPEVTNLVIHQRGKGSFPLTFE